MLSVTSDPKAVLIAKRYMVVWQGYLYSIDHFFQKFRQLEGHLFEFQLACLNPRNIQEIVNKSPELLSMQVYFVQKVAGLWVSLWSSFFHLLLQYLYKAFDGCDWSLQLMTRNIKKLILLFQ